MQWKKKVEIPLDELEQLKEQAWKAGNKELVKAIELMILKRQLIDAMKRLQRRQGIQRLSEVLGIPWVMTDAKEA